MGLKQCWYYTNVLAVTEQSLRSVKAFTPNLPKARVLGVSKRRGGDTARTAQ